MGHEWNNYIKSSWKRIQLRNCTKCIIFKTKQKIYLLSLEGVKSGPDLKPADLKSKKEK